MMHVPEPLLTAILLALLILALAASASPAEPNLQAGEDCVLKLGKSGIVAERAAHPAATAGAACVMADPVRLLAVADHNAGPRRIQFPEKPLLACAMAERVARFTADIAAPLAIGIFGQELAAVSTGPGYECRPRNRQPGAKMSSHGQGNAVDIASIELAGGRTIRVETPGDPAAIRFIAGLRAAACSAFNTVLGPGSDAAHANHIHVDIEPRGRDGQSKFCQ